MLFISKTYLFDLHIFFTRFIREKKNPTFLVKNRRLGNLKWRIFVVPCSSEWARRSDGWMVQIQFLFTFMIHEIYLNLVNFEINKIILDLKIALTPHCTTLILVNFVDQTGETSKPTMTWRFRTILCRLQVQVHISTIIIIFLIFTGCTTHWKTKDIQKQRVFATKFSQQW